MADKFDVCNLGFARLDMGRTARRGFPEVIYAPGKTREQLETISHEFVRRRQSLIITRLGEKEADWLTGRIAGLCYNKVARIGYRARPGGKRRRKPGFVAVLSAGTADIPVAEEAACVCELFGNRVQRIFDVGVAGVHRLMHNMRLIRTATVIIVVAGMEGALASLVSGLVRVPVIAVPTSCGYGASFSGLAALLTMLNGCSPGVAVVNIDNGFGAGYMAALINT